MAIRKGNFDRALELKHEKLYNENSEKKKRVLALIEKCKPFIDDIVDIVDTFWYVKSKDAGFGEKLWTYLVRGEIDVNSHWGFRSKKNWTSEGVTFTRSDAVIFYVPESHNLLNENDEKWEGVSLEDYLSTKKVSTEALLLYIDSLEDFYIKFPSYRDGFFKMIESYS